MAGSTSGISPSFLGLSRSSGQITHVLLTRSRLCPGPKPGSSLHLHVLSTPPAFVLSQDQTLREKPAWYQSGRSRFHCLQESCQIGSGRRTYTCCRPQLDGLIHMPPPRSRGTGDGRAWTRSGRAPKSPFKIAHAVEFSKTVGAPRRGLRPSRPLRAIKKASRERPRESSDAEQPRLVPVLLPVGLFKGHRGTGKYSPLDGGRQRVGRRVQAGAEPFPRKRLCRRFPTWSTRPASRSAGTSRSALESCSPSRRTPPPASSRRASELEIPKWSRSRAGTWTGSDAGSSASSISSGSARSTWSRLKCASASSAASSP